MKAINQTKINIAAFSGNKISSSNSSQPKQVVQKIINDNGKIKKALAGLAIAGIVIAGGVLLRGKKIKTEKTFEQITDITKDGINKLLKENKELTGKFVKTTGDGSKVVMEYANGTLVKSTKTASDGTQIFEKIYKKSSSGELFVNNKNITQAVNQAKKHQENFSNLIKKENASLEELQGFDRKNLSKKQIEELNSKIKATTDAIKAKNNQAEKAATPIDKTPKTSEIITSSESKTDKTAQNITSKEDIVKTKEEIISKYQRVSQGLEEMDVEEYRVLKQQYADIVEYDPVKSDVCKIRGHHGLNCANNWIRNDVDKYGISEAIIFHNKDFRELNPTTQDIIAYRGRLKSTINEEFNRDFKIIEKANPGDIVVPDTAYSYFAYHRELADVFKNSTNSILYEVKIPKGSRVSRSLEHGGEVLMPAGAKYKLISKGKDPEGTLNVVMEYIPEEIPTHYTIKADKMEEFTKRMSCARKERFYEEQDYINFLAKYGISVVQ